MKSSLKRLLLAPVAVLAFAGVAQAASISYFLDQSGEAALPDGSNYLQVTIADGADGAIDFTITPQAALLAQTGGHFGIRAFAFNTNFSQCLDNSNVVGLPTGFAVSTPCPYGIQAMDGFGKFETKVRKFGSDPWNGDLTFSIVGVSGDAPVDYVKNSTGSAPEGYVPFAARVQFLLDEPFCVANSWDPQHWCTDYGLAYVGGASPVPVPAAAWMFLTGFAGLVARARRRTA